MNRISESEERQEFAAERHSIWRMVLAPVIWAFHFLAAYVSAAMVCARFDHDLVDLVRLVMVGLTVVALLVIAWLGWRSWQQWDLIRDREWENDSGTAEDRTQFMGHAGFLLAIISFIGVAYVGIPLLMFGTCR